MNANFLLKYSLLKYRFLPLRGVQQRVVERVEIQCVAVRADVDQGFVRNPWALVGQPESRGFSPAVVDAANRAFGRQFFQFGGAVVAHQLGLADRDEFVDFGVVVVFAAAAAGEHSVWSVL